MALASDSAAARTLDPASQVSFRSETYRSDASLASRCCREYLCWRREEQVTAAVCAVAAATQGASATFQQRSQLYGTRGTSCRLMVQEDSLMWRVLRLGMITQVSATGTVSTLRRFKDVTSPSRDDGRRLNNVIYVSDASTKAVYELRSDYGAQLPLAQPARLFLRLDWRLIPACNLIVADADSNAISWNFQLQTAGYHA